MTHSMIPTVSGVKRSEPGLPASEPTHHWLVESRPPISTHLSPRGKISGHLHRVDQLESGDGQQQTQMRVATHSIMLALPF